MYLTGFYHKSFGYCINDIVICPNIGIQQTITFKIDSGCDVTTINFKDALTLQLDYSKLSTVESLTVSVDLVDSAVINNCALGFIINNNESAHLETLQVMHISKPCLNPADINYLKKLELHLRLPSLLGLDVLRRYKVSYFNGVVFLEK